MSAVETTTASVAAASSGPPRERRTLVALLAVLEGALVIAASMLAYLYSPQPVPVSAPLGSGPTASSCYGPGGPVNIPSSGPPPCSPVQSAYQMALLAAVACTLVALLVLPVVIGLVSRRWQSALAAPALPLWLVLLATVALSLVTKPSGYTGYADGGPLGNLSGVSIILSLAGPLWTALFLAAALGGLGWLARRAFAR